MFSPGEQVVYIPNGEKGVVKTLCDDGQTAWVVYNCGDNWENYANYTGAKTAFTDLKSVRWFGPKKEDHPSVGELCPVCHEPFKAGDYTMLVAIGTDNEEDKAKAKSGRVYNAVALEVHFDCGWML